MATEDGLRNSIVQMLQKQGYQRLPSYQNIDGDSFWSNFKTHLERLNSETLSDSPLTETEFERLKINLPKTTRTAYQTLREGIRLMLDDGTKTTLKLYDTLNNENNVYQVAEEVTAEGSTMTVRFDLILLINGIPFSNMELKRPKSRTGTGEAVSQINRYTAEGVYRKGLARFIQYYSVSNGHETKYFATNPKVDSTDMSKLRTQAYGSFVFRWTDENNVPANTAELFVKSFYHPTITHKLLTQYMLLLPPEINSIIILRPYQIYAVEAATHSVTEGNNSLIWHATGSGKTLTSFVLAKTLIERTPNKVVMLLDRNDLADQTIREYSRFDITGTIANGIVKGKSLHNALKDPTHKLVITTIQSYSRWAQRYKRTVHKLSNQPTVFIIDECHRSTFGDMFAHIRRSFTKSTFVGFTGTPIMPENAREHELITAELFGEPTHTYNIQNAIDDGNVLRFKVQNTQNSKTVPKNPDKSYYRNQHRINNNAEFITHNLKKHTQQADETKHPNTTGFTAMLATDGKASAIAYWELLTPALSQQNRTTAIVYSINENGEHTLPDGTIVYEKNHYTRILRQWDEQWGTNYAELAHTDFQEAHKNHTTDVIAKTKAGKIDLLIVSDMLLTGFDAPILSTIYLDKNLKYHNLLQAISRTNRTHSSDKQVGNVITFQDREMDQDLQDTIRLYSGGHPEDSIIDRLPYDEVMAKIYHDLDTLKKACPSPEVLDEYSNIKDLVHVSSTLNSIHKNLSLARLYTEWEERDYERLGTSEDDLDEYYTHLQQKRDSLRKTPRDTLEYAEDLTDLDFYIQEAGYYIIDVAYITNLLHSFVSAPPEAKEKWIKETEKSLKRTNSEEVNKTRQALENALTACKDGKVSSVDDLIKTLSHERTLLYKQKVRKLANDYELDERDFDEWVRFYQIHDQHSDKIQGTLKKIPGLSFKERRAKSLAIKETIETQF